MLGIFFPKPSKTHYFNYRSFTYFIPSPPPRKTGYREREFDTIFEKIINSGFDIVESNIEHCSNEKGGMWIHYILGSKTKQAAQMNLDEIDLYKDNFSPADDLEIEYLND